MRARRDRIVADKMAESLCSNAGRDLWIEAKKINSSGKPCPSNVDGQIGDDAVSSVFADNYKSLYNSVSFSPGEMCNLEIEISQLISDKCCTGACKSPHAISGESVREAIGYLKADKCDGILSNNHILNGCSQLVIHLSMLFSGMVRHGFSPPSMVLSTVIPIPKNARKSANDSSNYRGIALNSPIGKLFELVILCSHRDALCTSDLQFGYKKGLSTSSCTFVASEVIQHYLNGNNDVHVMLLDASKAFDCVHYITLFRQLLSKNFCPLVAKVLLYMHVNQSVRVRWNSYLSEEISVSNGVKQGGILSPVLFSIYTDVILSSLRDCGAGCYVGLEFCGSLAYADDIVLLAPTKAALRTMLGVARVCADRLSLRFNGTKSQYLVYRSREVNYFNSSIDFCDVTIPQAVSGIHLGNILGRNAYHSL